MTIKYLLDTNVISQPLKLVPDPGIMRHLERFDNQTAIPSIVWHELLVGCNLLPDSYRRKTIEQFLGFVTLPILPYDASAAKWHAIERARLIKIGQTPSFSDGQIAGIAATQNLTLVTINTSDFIHFDGLTLANWMGRSQSY